MTKELQQVYVDIANNFSINPFTKDLNMVFNEEAVKQSVKNLILTAFYERVGFPMIGSAVEQTLFEPNDAISASNLKNTITEVITNYEPRVAIQNINLVTNVDGVSVTVYFIVKLTQKITQVNLTVKRYR